MRIKELFSADPGGNTVLSSQLSYDTMDNITARQTEHGDYSYGYDALDRLTSASLPGLAGQSSAEAFTYDNVGNRLTSAEAAGTWTYNDNNELLSLPGLSGQSSPASFEYDANGNMVRRVVDSVVTSYVYNIEDRLVEVWSGEVSIGSLTASYYYDPFGRRLWKDVGGAKTYYHYADEGLVAEMDAAGNVTKSYGWQPGSTWGTDPLFMRTGGEYYFYHNDHLGTPQKLTASNGAVVWSAYYSSFGKAEIAAESTVVNNLRFPGQYWDSESGLHWNWFRYYDPGVGRYLRVDPIRISNIILVRQKIFNDIRMLPGKKNLDSIIQEADAKLFSQVLQNLNCYTYSNNNSINLIDPTGEFAPIILGGIVGGAIAGSVAGGIAGAVSSFLAGDSLSGVINSAIVGALIGGVAGGVAGGFVGAGLLHPPLFLAAGDFWTGVTMGMGIGGEAAISSRLGALAGAIASIFTDPSDAYGSDSQCEE